MNIGVLTFFAGINIAFALLGFLVYQKNSTQSFYHYFALFSLFSGIYLSFLAFSEVTLADLSLLILTSAGIYYAVFPWFIFKFIGHQNAVIPWIFTVIYTIAILVYIITPSEMGYPLWQMIAHIGLIGLVAITWYASIILKRNKTSGSREFIVLTVIFTILAIEEVLTAAIGQPFFTLFTNELLLLDFYPILFTLIIGIRLSSDVHTNYKIRLEAMQNVLNEEKLKLEESERQRLENELRNKNKDLTDFGIEIARKKEFTEHLYSKIINLKKHKKVDSSAFKDIDIFMNAHMRIDNEINFLQRNIESVNHEFISTLKENCPELTASDLHLASLLKLKFNTKEIATIKNISPDSVKVMRYRLRKKLGLPKDKNLSEYIQNLA